MNERTPQMRELDQQLNFWLDERDWARRAEMIAQGNIERINLKRDLLSRPLETQLDLPDLHQTFKERVLETLLQGLDSIHNRITPS